MKKTTQKRKKNKKKKIVFQYLTHVSSLGERGNCSCFAPSGNCSCLVLQLFAHALGFFTHVSSVKGNLLMSCPSALCSGPRSPCSCFVPRGKMVARVWFFGPLIMFIIQALLMICPPVLQSCSVLASFAHF